MQPIERTVGSKNCGSKRCEVCMEVNETSTFTSIVTGEIFIINDTFDCNARYLVYLLHIINITWDMLVRQQINFAQVGITAKVISENITKLIHATTSV